MSIEILHIYFTCKHKSLDILRGHNGEMEEKLQKQSSNPLVTPEELQGFIAQVGEPGDSILIVTSFNIMAFPLLSVDVEKIKALER